MGHEETLLWCCHAPAPWGTGPVALPEAARQSCFFSKTSLRSGNASLPLAGNGILASLLGELLLIKEGELPAVGACPGACSALPYPSLPGDRSTLPGSVCRIAPAKLLVPLSSEDEMPGRRTPPRPVSPVPLPSW